MQILPFRLIDRVDIFSRHASQRGGFLFARKSTTSISTLLLIGSELDITFSFCVSSVPSSSFHLPREYRWRQRLLTMCLRPFCGHTMLLHITSYRGECHAGPPVVLILLKLLGSYQHSLKSPLCSCVSITLPAASQSRITASCEEQGNRVKYWEMIVDNLSKAEWSCCGRGDFRIDAMPPVSLREAFSFRT